MKKLVLCCLAAAVFLPIAPSARAVYVLTVAQMGNNVVLSGQGSFNLAGLTLVSSSATGFDGLTPPNAKFGVGTPTSGKEYTGLIGPTTFGFGPGKVANSGTGDFTYLYGEFGELTLPVGYVSGSFLTGTATINTATLVSLGFTPGTYVYTWGSGINADSLTITSVVPEPSTWVLVGVGAIGAGFVALRRRQSIRG